MNYYFIKNKKLIRTDIYPRDIKNLYKEFYDNEISIKKANYPVIFLDSLDLSLEQKHIYQKFSIWCIKKIQNYIINLSKRIWIFLSKKNKTQFHKRELIQIDCSNSKLLDNINFKRRRLYNYRYPFSHLKSPFESMTHYINNNVNNGKIGIIYNNLMTNTHNIAVLDMYQIELLDKLSTIGINDIQIVSILNFPRVDFIKNMLEYYGFNNKKLPVTFYKIHKSLQPTKPCKGVLIQSVIEFLFSIYEFKLNSKTEFNTVYNNFITFNNITFCRMELNTIIDYTLFEKILTYLHFPIKDNMILNLQKKDNETFISLNIRNKLSKFMTKPKVHKELILERLEI